MKTKRNFTSLLGAALIILLTSSILMAADHNVLKIMTNEFLTRLGLLEKEVQETHPQDRVYLQFDKSLYSPGETIWFSAHIRNALNMKASQKSDLIHIELIDPKGNLAKEYTLIANKGLANGDLTIDANAPGGLYKVKAYTNWQKNEADPFFFEKELTIQKVVLPNVKMSLEFEREAHGPGDKVIAKLTLESNENKALVAQEFAYTASLAGEELLRKNASTDGSGKAMISFELPANLKTTDGLLNVMFSYNGLTESISRSIPIVLNNIQLSFFPEGGDMVIGTENTVAFKAVNEFGKPADLQGKIIDEEGKEEATFKSFHDGMGSFSFIPRKDKNYTAVITQPLGIAATFDLPEGAEKGYVLHVHQQTKEDVQLSVYSSFAEELSLVVKLREKTYYANAFQAIKGLNTLSIPLKDIPIGVAQITLFDSKEIARAERLVFLNKDKQLNIEIKTNKDKYLPREEVKMEITVKDERGLGMPGIFSLAVVDDNNLSFADDKSGNILAKMLLEPDIRGEIHEAKFYFNPEEEKATEAIDYLLLTHGWRRFTWKEIVDRELPAVEFPSEKAILSGVVMDNRMGGTVAKASITHLASKKTVETDKSGKFNFGFIDLSLGNKFKIEAEDMPASEQTVSDYSSKHTFYINNVIFFQERMMMGAGMANEGLEMDANIPKQANRKLQKADVMEMPPPPPPPPAIDVMDIEEDREDLEIIEMEVMDEAFNGKWAGDIMPPEEEGVSFYRAREFAMPDYSKATGNEKRTDFRSTIYWNGRVETGNNGKASCSFYASDAITSFKATLEGFSEDGMIGHAEQKIFTQKALSLKTKLPTVLVMEDQVEIPLTISNNTKGMIDALLNIDHSPSIKPIGSLIDKTTIKAGESKTLYLAFDVLQADDSARLSINIQGAETEDEVEQIIKIVPRGFPTSVSFSAQEIKKDFNFSIRNMVQQTLSAQIIAYPTVTSELLSGIEDILREPYGCFEQTSSSNYPNIMVLQYLRSMDIEDPEMEGKALALLDKGYNKLVGFETPTEGYEWFGGSPGHEALTAYGVLEFVDMQSVYPKVDQVMIDRTANWLMERRDGNGGFKKNVKALDNFGRADDEITNAYIVYSLSEAGFFEIQKEFLAVYEASKKSKDPYTLALVACAAFNLKEDAKGAELMKLLLATQADDGSFTGTRHSITRSGGISLTVETTSLSVLAILKSAEKNGAVMTKAVEFIVNARSGFGGFGSTQATVLALKALTVFAAHSKKIQEDGVLEVYANKKKVTSIEYKAGDSDPIKIEGFEGCLHEGMNNISIRFKDAKEALPYTAYFTWNTEKPESSSKATIDITTKLFNTKTKVGETVRLTTTVSNKTEEGQPMTMAVIGIPAGMSVQPWQLKEHLEKGVFDFYEIIDNRLACYYRQMTPGEVRVIDLDLKAEMPGTFKAPASTGYLYYTNEHRTWSSIEDISIEK